MCLIWIIVLSLCHLEARLGGAVCLVACGGEERPAVVSIHGGAWYRSLWHKG
jgi:hypothetical protein